MLMRRWLPVEIAILDVEMQATSLSKARLHELCAGALFEAAGIRLLVFLSKA
jgi:hypothetical protein